MLSTASTQKSLTSAAAFAFAIIVFAAAPASGEAARDPSRNGARVGNWAGAPPVKRNFHNRSADGGIKIIQRAADRESCQNTLFVPAHPHKCQSEHRSLEIAHGENSDLEATSPVQKTVVPDPTPGVTKTQRSPGEKTPTRKSTARLNVEEPKKVKSESNIDPQPAQPEALKKDQPQSPSNLSCDKVAAIVSDYGFNSIRPSNCDGQVYAFNASRDGKSFLITLNAMSGELITVRKVSLDVQH